MVEQHVGYNLTPRYHEEEVFWDGTSSRIQLDWPGITDVNVVQLTTTVAEDVSISPFVIEDAPVTGINGYCIVTLDRRFIDNPDNAIIRNAETDEVIPHQEVSGYPRRNGDGDWLVALGRGINSPCDTPSVNVQHCKLMAVTMATPECEGDIYATYAGTDEHIPFAKDPVVNGAETTYWFRPWSLTDPDFSDSTINLERGEFYKLVNVVDFVCEANASAAPVITEVSRCDCTSNLVEDATAITAEILSSEHSIIRIRYSDTCGCRCKTPIKLKIYYRTDTLNVVDEGSILALQEAIAYLTAAELPMSSCGCELPDGNFISNAQKAYAEYRINPITGATVANIKFNSLTGQLIFAERLSKAKKVRKLVQF
jgi:hypothetical protein